MNGLLQQKHAARTERARDERLRQDRLAAYLAFAQSLSEFRGAQFERWFARRDHTTDSDEDRRAREETHRTGAAARNALFRVQLVILQEELIGLAHEAYSLVFAIESVDDEGELNKRMQNSREKTEAFIIAAGRLGKVR